MKLFYYEHCPYCVRVLAFAYLQNIKLENIVLLNDDEQIPIDLIGKKILPILVTESGEAMPESLDIMRYLDDLNARVLPKKLESALFNSWSAKAKSVTRPLLFPRMVEYPFKEFATESARAYFIKKKSQSVGDFSGQKEKTALYLEQLMPLLADLESDLCNSSSVDLTMDDWLLFPELRLLTLIPGVEWPPELREYLEQKADQFNLPLYS